MRLISKKKLNLAKHTGRSSSRISEFLNIQGNDAYVSDGHTLFHIYEEEPSTDDFPEVDIHDISADSYFIRPETAAKTLKNFPKSKNLPILNYALLTEAEKLSLTTTDLENTVTVQQKKEDVPTEEWEKVIPKEIITETSIDFKLLQKLIGAIADYQKEAGFTGGRVRVKFSFEKLYPDYPPVLVCSVEGGDNSTFKAVVMPLGPGK